MKTSHAVALILLFLACVTSTAAQRDERFETIITEDSRCELRKLYFDLIDIDAAEDSTIIIIAKLGSGEASRFNRRRLQNIYRYLTYNREIPEERVVTATGQRIRGRGRIEVYVNGRLFVVFILNRNQDLIEEDCI